MKIVIIAAGTELPTNKIEIENIKSADLLICADGGMDFLSKNLIVPDILIGDFDSISESAVLFLENLSEEEKSKIEKLEFPIKKAKSDLELALDYVLSLNNDLESNNCIKLCEVYGATGTRLDHSLCNIFFLEKYAKKGLQIVLKNDKNEIRYLTKGIYAIEAKNEKTYHSFLAYPEDCKITLKNFEYEVENQNIEIGSSLAISNHVLNSVGIVEVDGRGVFSISSID